MILFSESYDLVALKTYKSNNSAKIAFQLFVAALNSKAFTEILLNHAERIHDRLNANDIELTVDNLCGINVEDIDTVGLTFHFLLQHRAEVFHESVAVILEANKQHWLGHEYSLKKVVGVIFDLAHLHNMIVKDDGSTDRSKKELVTESLLELSEDMAKVIRLGTLYIDNVYTPDAVTFQKDVFDSIEYLSSVIKGESTFERTTLLTGLSDVLNRIAADFVHYDLSSKHKKFINTELQYSENAKYNQSYSHLNNNENIGVIELPPYLLSPLPFSSNDVHGLIDISNLDSKINKSKLDHYISYTLDYSCTCEHDCCGCVQRRFRTFVLNSGMALVTVSHFQNV